MKILYVTTFIEQVDPVKVALSSFSYVTEKSMSFDFFCAIHSLIYVAKNKGLKSLI
jgi:hypothetical protein